MDSFIEKLKRAWKSRTVLYGLLLSIALYMQASYATFTPLILLLPPGLQPMIPAFLGIVVIVLRFITSQPLEHK